MNHYRASTLPVSRGPAAWNRILPAPPDATRLTSDLRVDITIVGAGFAGLSAARRLRQADARLSIAVVDATRLAEGAAGRNSGFMIDLPHELTSDDYAGSGIEQDRRLISLNRQAISFAREAVEEYDIDRNFFDECGKINGAAGESAHHHNTSYARHLEQLGEHCQMLDQQEMREITGSAHYYSGLLTPGTVLLQPAGYIRALAVGLKKTGVQLFEDSPVTQFQRDGTGWVVHTPGGKISTHKIILANNGHLESFGIERGRLLQIFLYASMSEALSREACQRLGGLPRWGVTPSDPMGTTVRRIDTPLGGNRIITRTCSTMRAGLSASAADVTRFSRVHENKFRQRFPQLAGVRQEMSWAGHLCLSLNNVSVVREVDAGVYTACVQNGLGTTRGTLTGIAAADLALGKASDISTYYCAQDRPKKLPPQPFASIGANAWMRYREWRASNE